MFVKRWEKGREKLYKANKNKESAVSDLTTTQVEIQQLLAAHLEPLPLAQTAN